MRFWFMKNRVPVSNASAVTYVCSTELLYRILCGLYDSAFLESECFVSGISLGNILIPMSIFRPPHAERTSVSASADPLSIYDICLHNIRFGQSLCLFCHLHPGSGPSSVYPSAIDFTTQQEWEKNFPVIGVIFNRSGYFRFFSAGRMFRIGIKGKGVEYHGDNIYRIRAEEGNQDESIAPEEHIRGLGIRFLY